MVLCFGTKCLELNVKAYRNYDSTTWEFDFKRALKEIEIPEHSIVLLHACAYNLTIINLRPEQWVKISAMVEKRKLPFFVMAYQRFTTEDLFAVPAFLRTGTPLYSNRFEDIIKKAKHEAEVYLRSGMDALLIENMHDLPYIQNEYFEPETVACMSRLALAVKEIIRDVLPCGIQILACGNKEALATAKACDLDFIRAEGFVFSHVADEGYTNANAGHILRYRKRIDAQHISIITDIKKKHSSHAITSDVSLCDTAKSAELFLSDGLIITGSTTGRETAIEDIQSIKGKVNLPLIVGSGITLDNISRYWNIADAAIVGSYFKIDGNWRNELNEERVRLLMKEINKFRKHST